MRNQADKQEITQAECEYSLLRVVRAVGDLRCGQPVILSGGDGNAVLAMAAEYATPALIDRMEGIGEGESFVLISNIRASRLGIAIKKGKAVRVATQSVSDVQGFIDPTVKTVASQIPLRETTSLLSDEPLLALLKIGALLPAAIVVDIKSAAHKETILRQNNVQEVDIAAIENYPVLLGRTLHLASEASVPLVGAPDAKVIAFRSRAVAYEHLAILIGNPKKTNAPLVRVHSSCITGDVLSSLRCDCGDQLKLAIETMSREGGGIILYLSQEGRGIGIVNKLRAYSLQDGGLDTVEANEEMGFLSAAEMLKTLGFTNIRLVTNNPHKVTELQHYGINVVERVPSLAPVRDENRDYLETKAKRCGHVF